MGGLTRSWTRLFKKTIAQIRQVAFVAYLTQQIVGDGGRQWFSGV